MKNSPFEPLFGEKPQPSDFAKQQSVKQMEDLGKKVQKPSLQQKVVSKPPAAKESAKTLSGLSNFSNLLTNKKVLLIGILLVLVIVVIVVIMYRQKKQNKSISTLAKQLKMLKASK